MACRIVEPGSAFGSWGQNSSFAMPGVEDSSSPQFAMKQMSNTDSNSLFSFHGFPSHLKDRTPVLHSRVIKLREEDHQLAEYVLEGMDPPRENHRPPGGHITSLPKDISLNYLSRPFIPSPLGMRSVAPVWGNR
ncbi:hypothetical protein O6H91_11G089900 [Diphasiastrum complanatum]|uniref:Uncharacterized protein n=2 Tax=Diphasiastrum complanatum TaxID=34168 RepID=A0ACC2CBW9_DIPCM|nr:hypothetical protein O6H91_11G069000 [Diphasiastrum complanatum]KAJ7539378.1 hypothetical protein O6H91_11G089900 [Diphasiastrum complanatum]